MSQLQARARIERDLQQAITYAQEAQNRVRSLRTELAHLPDATRQEALRADYERLGSLRKVGALHGISGERVRQILEQGEK